jgi:hypothetical protein
MAGLHRHPHQDVQPDAAHLRPPHSSIQHYLLTTLLKVEPMPRYEEFIFGLEVSLKSVSRPTARQFTPTPPPPQYQEIIGCYSIQTGFHHPALNDERRYSPVVCEQGSWTVQMYSNLYGRVRRWSQKQDARLPSTPNPCSALLTWYCMYICEHFANFVRELLVNIACDHEEVLLDIDGLKCCHLYYPEQTLVLTRLSEMAYIVMAGDVGLYSIFSPCWDFLRTKKGGHQSEFLKPWEV